MGTRKLALLLLLSAGSGVAALIYEVVWFQMLELVIGSTAIALGILLATFMGGMCLGSLVFPRVVSAGPKPLRVYAAIELGIGVLGVLVLLLMPNIGSALCLLLPTLLMGATLPALARSVDVAQLGVLYASNIVGAIFGCLLAGFYLLREYDVATATYVAAGINAAVGGIALLLPSSAQRETPAESAGGGDKLVYVAIALSGLCALAGEAIWTRLLALLFGGSVYTFSLILAVFLTGLGIGSGCGSLLCRIIERPRVALGWCQLLGAGAIAWTAYTIGASLPFWPVDPSISTSVWFNFALDLSRAAWALLPPTLLWGASFPLALAAAAPNQDSARIFSRVYAANTLGAIAGALGASLVLVAWVGSQRTEQMIIALSAIAGMLLLPRRTAIVTAVAAALLIYSVPELPKLLVAHGRFAATWAGKSDIVYAREGLQSSVAVSRFPNGAVTFHVAGKIQASNVPRDMRLQRMLGHLTTLVAASPRSVLVIGCGAGITAGAVSIDPRVERETIVEIEPLVPATAAEYFSGPNFNVIANPKVEVHIDDGRHYLLTAKDRFDGITIDPLDPWAKGAASLYTKEFFESMKQHLNPGGTVTMYIQLFETNEAAVKSAVATFLDVFPNGTLWGNTYEGQGHDMVLLGQVEPLRIDLDALQQRLYHAGDDAIAQSLAEVGITSPVDLFATYAGRKSDLTAWLRGAEINHDRDLRMQYLAGFGLNLDNAATIYAGMLAHRRFPDDLFVSREGLVDSLRRALAY